MTDRIDYFGGATFSTSENVTNFGAWAGASHGNYIFTKIKDEVTGKFRDYVLSNGLYMHEYGHYIQSQDFGLFYLSKLGIPSLFSKNTIGSPHNHNPVEQDANIRAFIYFNEHIDGYSGWDFRNPALGGNPIIGYDPSQAYRDLDNQMALKRGLLKLQWYDYLIYKSTFIPSLINTIIYNSRY